jgi:hypothetical protein
MFTRILEQAFPVPIPFSAAIPTLRSLRRPALFVEISKRKCAVFNFLVDLYARAGINRGKGKRIRRAATITSPSIPNAAALP